MPTLLAQFLFGGTENEVAKPRRNEDVCVKEGNRRHRCLLSRSGEEGTIVGVVESGVFAQARQFFERSASFGGSA